MLTPRGARTRSVARDEPGRARVGPRDDPAVVPTATRIGTIPTFKLNGRPLVGFGAVKGHCAFYLMSTAVMDAHRDELAAYDLGKGTIRFQPDAPVPNALVRTLVEARIAENDRGARR